MKNIFIIIIFLFITITTSCTKNNSNRQEFNIDSIGTVRFELFDDAIYESFREPNFSRPILKITQKSNNNFLIILLFDSLKHFEEIDYTKIKDIVIKDGNNLLNKSVENKIEITKLSNSGCVHLSV